MASSTGTSPTSTISSAGSAAVSKRESFVASHTATASVSPPSGRSSAVAGSSFITSTKTSSAAVDDAGPQQRQVHVGEHAVGVRAEAARGVVERRVDAAHARVDGEERQRVEAHDVGEDQPERACR